MEAEGGRYPLSLKLDDMMMDEPDADLELPFYLTKQRLYTMLTQKEEQETRKRKKRKRIEVEEEPILNLKKREKHEKLPKDLKERNRELAVRFNKLDGVMTKTVIQPGFEQLERAPKYNPSLKSEKRKRKKESQKTKGADWYNLPATEMTAELKRELEVIKMRSVLDKKRFYKESDLKVLPKYFQKGKVVAGAADYYSSRLTKKETKKSLVDELLADSEFQQMSKKRQKQIEGEKRRKGQVKGAHKHAKRLKKQKT